MGTDLNASSQVKVSQERMGRETACSSISALPLAAVELREIVADGVEGIDRQHDGEHGADDQHWKRLSRSVELAIMPPQLGAGAVAEKAQSPQ